MHETHRMLKLQCGKTKQNTAFAFDRGAPECLADVRVGIRVSESIILILGLALRPNSTRDRYP